MCCGWCVVVWLLFADVFNVGLVVVFGVVMFRGARVWLCCCVWLWFRGCFALY